MARRSLEQLVFDNSYARLPEAFYARVHPTPFSSEPYVVAVDADTAISIDLDPQEAARPEFAQLFGGSLLLSGMEPLAMLYAGHQFGVYVPQLGDGRAVLLGEVVNERGERWDLHLKGAGRTPFSRDGDGRAVLRSTIREYLCCAAMRGLGIPTTQALCIIGSDDKVYREQVETGAMLLRLAPCHVRFGTFEVFYHRRQYDHLKTLADYVIDYHYPHLAKSSDRYEQFFDEVVGRTAKLIAQWQAVGWAHGVLNTDNMSILGLTLDYGPFGFMDDYDPGFICNHSDVNGRYAFNQQPAIGLWNLGCLAQTLTPLVAKEALRSALEGYHRLFREEYLRLMCAKLGLVEKQSDDEVLIDDFLSLLHEGQVDYSIAFRALGSFSSVEGIVNDALQDHFVDRDRLDNWAARYRERLQRENSRDDERRLRMNRVNPKYVLRNYLAHLAIEKAQQKDFSEIDRLLTLLRRPYDDQPAMEPYAASPPNWGKHLAVSCSS